MTKHRFAVAFVAANRTCIAIDCRDSSSFRAAQSLYWDLCSLEKKNAKEEAFDEVFAEHGSTHKGHGVMFDCEGQGHPIQRRQDGSLFVDVENSEYEIVNPNFYPTIVSSLLAIDTFSGF